MQQTSFSRYATETAASLPSTVATISVALRDHLDRVHGALLEAGPAAGAAVVVEPVAVPDPQLDHGVLGACAEAAVAFEAVAARQTPGRLIDSLLGGEAADHLAEIRDPLLGTELGLPAAGRAPSRGADRG